MRAEEICYAIHNNKIHIRIVIMVLYSTGSLHPLFFFLYFREECQPQKIWVNWEKKIEFKH